MNIEKVKEIVRRIKGTYYDAEEVHCFHIDVLRTIANGVDNAAEMAAQALKTEDD